MNRRSFLIGASALASLSLVPRAWASSSRYIVFFGSRTQQKGQGIFSCFFDAKTGQSSAVELASEMEFPTAFAVSANKRVLYSTIETGNDGKSNGMLASFSIDHNTGKLMLMNRISAGGGGPTSICLDATGRNALVANFGAGSTNVFRVLPDGRLGEQTASAVHSGTGPKPRQSAPHAHQVVLSPDNRFLISPDLGADRVFISEFDAVSGGLVANKPAYYQMPAGSGPRQVVFHPNGKYLYLMNELTAKMTVFSWNSSGGNLTEIQTVAAGAENASGGAIAISTDGRYLYSNTRIDNSVEVFTIDRKSGKLSEPKRVASGGKTPWGIALDPGGDHLLVMNMDSNSISTFRIDRRTGSLALAGPDFSVPTPVSGIFVPALN
jgi:6-phosphogluconolactonase